MVLASLAEIISIGAALPFLGALINPQHIFNLPLLKPLINFFAISTPNQLLIWIVIGFGFAALIAGSLRLLLLWASTRLSYAIGADLCLDIYRKTLYQPYATHLSRNSSEIINGVSYKAKHTIVVINMTLMLISSTLLLLTILLTLFALHPLMALITFGGFSFIYVVIAKATRWRLLKNSQHIAHESNQVLKSLQEGLGGIRDVIIDGTHEIYCGIYRKADSALRNATASNLFISASPRYIVETSGMILIAILAYMFVSEEQDDIAGMIPLLGALALGAQRLLPILQQTFSAWSGIQGSQATLQDVLGLLNQPLPHFANLPPPCPLTFRSQISLRKVTFRYSEQATNVLRCIDLTILKGSRVGFIGATGSGKSTLIDIIMGLLKPIDGLFEIDGEKITEVNQRSWQAHIAHVPQTIFLADCTIEENIAFGIPKEKIDSGRVRLVAQLAKISEDIETWSKKYQTIVGERGICLSGGQRQRIGIARALYKAADVIILDEATSALDNETEEAVMESIEGLNENYTMLIIAHRLSTLKNCTQIVELGEGKIKWVGSYEEMITQRRIDKAIL